MWEWLTNKFIIRIIGHIVTLGFTLTVLNDFRWFLSQFLTNCVKTSLILQLTILQAVSYRAAPRVNPFHAYPGPCPGILILITMPIPDRVRASLQLIHCMLNSRQVWPDASSVLQNNIGVYYSAIWWLFGGYRPLLRSGLAVYGHFVGLIHKTVAVLMFWSELKQFACIQSQCHRKLGEQQLNSVGLRRATLIHIAGIVCRFIHSLQQTQYVQQVLV